MMEQCQLLCFSGVSSFDLSNLHPYKDIMQSHSNSNDNRTLCFSDLEAHRAMREDTGFKAEVHSWEITGID